MISVKEFLNLKEGDVIKISFPWITTNTSFSEFQKKFDKKIFIIKKIVNCINLHEKMSQYEPLRGYSCNGGCPGKILLDCDNFGRCLVYSSNRLAIEKILYNSIMDKELFNIE
jgi:hypothetical protein